MTVCYCKERLEDLQLWKLKAIARHWNIKGFSRKRKAQLEHLIFTHSNNKDSKYLIDTFSISKPEFLIQKETNQKEKRKKQRRKKRERSSKKEKNQKTKTTTKQPCHYCMSKKRNCYFLPCGHTGCFSCAMKLFDGKNECPLCRQMVREVVKWENLERVQIAVPKHFVYHCQFCQRGVHEMNLSRCGFCEEVFHERCKELHDCESDGDEDDSSAYVFEEPLRRRRRLNHNN